MSDHHGPREPEISFAYHFTAMILMIILLTAGVIGVLAGPVLPNAMVLAFAFVTMIANAVPFFTHKAGSPGPVLCGIVFPILITAFLSGGVWAMVNEHEWPGVICLFVVIPLILGHVYALWRSWDSLHPPTPPAADGDHHSAAH